MSTTETLAILEEMKKYIEPYRSFGPVVDEGIKNIDQMSSLIREGKLEEAYGQCCSLLERFGSYRSFVPELAKKMDRLKEILGNQCKT